MSRSLLLIFLTCSAALAADPPKEIPGWGTPVDPLGDCTIKEEFGALTISIPASVHDLWHGQNEPGRLAAPRVLRKAKGDFLLKVKVSADWRPGAKLEAAANIPYNGAGLLVWDTDQHFMRWERNHFDSPRSGLFSLQTPFYDREGKHVHPTGRATFELFRGNVSWIGLERVGPVITCAVSHDGKKWYVTDKVTTEFPEEVQVGVIAVNGSDRVFSVEFDELTLEQK